MCSLLPSPGAVLLLIDLQRAIDHPSWGERNNPHAESQVRRLLVHWRRQGWPVWHVRHDSTHPESHYRPGQPGHEFKPEATPVAGEPVIPKQTNSAFIGTDLEARLRAGGARCAGRGRRHHEQFGRGDRSHGRQSRLSHVARG
ncbi:isochorismatase family protein [Burkholderia ubonensis]|uniref:isochorismatase family protein n=1 Tax=Burkholderia ubonensis TaxID=101571 RepID=UPI002FC9666C